MSDKNINEIFERMFDDNAKAKLQMYEDMKEIGFMGSMSWNLN